MCKVNSGIVILFFFRVPKGFFSHSHQGPFACRKDSFRSPEGSLLKNRHNTQAYWRLQTHRFKKTTVIFRHVQLLHFSISQKRRLRYDSWIPRTGVRAFPQRHEPHTYIYRCTGKETEAGLKTINKPASPQPPSFKTKSERIFKTY